MWNACIFYNFIKIEYDQMPGCFDRVSNEFEVFFAGFHFVVFFCVSLVSTSSSRSQRYKAIQSDESGSDDRDYNL